jgi:hypothetical protein
VALYAELLAGSDYEPGVNASPLRKQPAARMARHDGREYSREGLTCQSRALPRLIITISALFLTVFIINKEIAQICIS